ncbi:MAG: DNA translocase FtsK 4TM domain-containing protein, partial [Armatimonadetes bacterium]|nr:DNA translocase FtsK 4TM domain-containing protein [Armatimonadota bacterium]
MLKGQRDNRLRRDIIGIGLAALGAVVLVSLVYGQQGTGFLPQVVSQGLLLAFGVGAYLTPVILLALGVLHMLERQDLGDIHTAMGLGLLFLIVMILFQLSVPLEDFFAREAVLEGGGYVGAALGWLLLKVVGPWGSYIVLLALGVVAILLVTGVSVQGLAGRTVSMLTEGGVRARRTVSRNLPSREAGLRARAEKTVRRNGSARRSLRGPRVQLDDDEAPSDAATEERESSDGRRPEGSNPESATEPKTGIPPASQQQSGRPQLQLVSEPTGFTPPPLTLLSKEGMDLQTGEMRQEIAERIIKLEDTLESFGISATVGDYECGPVLTRYEVEPEKGIRVNKIARLADDLAMSLAAV